MAGPWATLEELARDRKLGAHETAERATRVLARLDPRHVLPGVEVLVRGHPAMAPLWRLGSAVLGGDEVGAAAEAFLEDLRADLRAPSAIAPLLPDSLVTISCSASVIEAIRQRRPSRVTCMRSEPGGEGTRTSELLRDWTESTVAEDDQALEELPGETVLVGADAVTPRSVVNKVKTRELVGAARERGVPALVVAGLTKLVPRDLPPAETFQPTPLGWFDGIALPQGVLSPEEVARLAEQVPLHPDLLKLLDDF